MCAITGFWQVQRAALRNSVSLYALHHRAHDFAGMTVSGENLVNTVKGKGGVGQVMTPECMATLMGENAIGQLRYPTANDSENAQPLFMQWGDSWIAAAHNGNFTNTPSIMVTELPNVKFETGMDSEVLLQLIVSSRPSMPTDIDELCEIIDIALGKMHGSGSLTILTPYCLLAVRDKSGNRPLVYGRHPDGGIITASEESALFVHGIYESTLVDPGTIVCFLKDRQQIYRLQHGNLPLQFCPFENAYYSMFTGQVNGIPGDDFRIELGKQLAQENPVPNADLIMPIPDSGIPAAIGFAMANGSGMYMDNGSGMYNDLYMRRSHYVPRTFISPTQSSRDEGVKLKFHLNPRKIKGKIIVLIDDSLVRGTTTQDLINILYAMGAKEVHVRIAWPIWQYICTYGIATKEASELAVRKHRGVDGTRQYIGASSLEFISFKGLKKVIRMFAEPLGFTIDNFCFACINGEYKLG